MRVLVTGANGFLGTETLRALLAREHQVYAIVRPERDTAHFDVTAPEALLIRLDLRDAAAVRNSLDRCRPQVLVHLAWYMEPGKCLTDRRLNMEMLEASIGMLRACTEAGVGRVVLGGSCLEGVKSQANVPYSSAKRALHEIACGSLLEEISIVCAHIFSPYGPGENAQRLIPSLMRNLICRHPIPLGHGRQERDFIYVEDVATALCLLAENDVTGQADVCTGESHSVREVANLVSKLVGGAECLRWDTREVAAENEFHACGSPEKLNQLGWRPQYSLSEGLDRTRIWWTEQLGEAGNTGCDTWGQAE